MKIMPELSETQLASSLQYLRCPACLKNFPGNDDNAGELAIGQGNALRLECGTCSASYPVVNGVIDFLPGYEEASSPGLAQWFMENPTVVNFYEKYFRPAFTRMGSPIRYDEEIKWLKSVLPGEPVRCITDLACGTGKYSRLLHRHLGPDLVFAVDISMPMLQKAETMAAAEGATNILHVRADAAALPLKNQSINGINCFGALHLFPETGRTIAEIGRIAAENAFFTCLTARKLPIWRPVQVPFSKLFSFHFFDEEWMEARLARSGFRDFQKTVNRMVLMFACIKV
ncbi:MAG: class I SAM-dependent methyltransferase [Thermodesulfobacteriota bacterium]|nr:class I SAM-dependent methyltransferase [Thermodesulfobacteriota bacterium]